MSARAVFRRPGVAPMMLAGILGRLPMGMFGLALTLLIVGQAGSYALAGTVAATMTITMAVIGPYNAQLVDRIGQGRAIPLLLAAHVTAYLLLAAAVSFVWPTASWYLLAMAAGASAPNMGAMTRARWVGIARSGSERSSAFAVESVADEISFVVGPVIASTLAIAVAPTAPILVGMLALTVGGLWLASQRRTAPTPGKASGGPRPSGHVIRVPGLGTLFGVLLAMGAMFGTLHVSVVAFAQATEPAMVGVLLASMSFGSLLSGVALGAITRRWTLTNQVRLGTLTLTLAILPLAWIGAPAVFAGMAFLLGLNFSVVMIGVFGLAERMTPRARITEGLALMGSALALGTSAGTALAGVIIDTAGPSPALGLGALCAATAMTVFWLTSRSTARREGAADAGELPIAEPEPALAATAAA